MHTRRRLLVISAVFAMSGQYKAAVQQVDAEIASGRKPMTLGRASELYCAEVVSGKPGEEPATRELAWIESVLGAEAFLHDLSQAHITKVRNERRVMTTTRGAGKDEKGRLLEKLVSHSTVNRTMQTLRAALYHVRDHHEALLKPNLKFGVTKRRRPSARPARPRRPPLSIRYARTSMTSSRSRF